MRRAARPTESKDQAQLKRGKVVFAENCARCHSSKAPTPAEESIRVAVPAQDYLDCWNHYWAWTKTDDYKNKMREIVLKDDFLMDNYLSTELRVPVTLLQTNACSPLATNAIAGNIWDNFSSKLTSNCHRSGPSPYTIRSPANPDPTKCPPAVADIPGPLR